MHQHNTKVRHNRFIYTLLPVVFVLAYSSIAQAQNVLSMDIALFNEDAFTQEPEIVECKTSAGTQTSCYKLTTNGGSAGRELGHFCPRTITDDADVVGRWFSKAGTGELVDLTGEFIVSLNTYYDDANWKLYDPETRKVRYTATEAACLGAAKPNVEEQYRCM